MLIILLPTGLPFLAPQVPISLSPGDSVVLPKTEGGREVECVGKGGGQFDPGVVGLVGQVVGGRAVVGALGATVGEFVMLCVGGCVGAAWSGGCVGIGGGQLENVFSFCDEPGGRWSDKGCCWLGQLLSSLLVSSPTLDSVVVVIGCEQQTPNVCRPSSLKKLQVS